MNTAASPRPLAYRPNLEQYRKQAKDLLKARASADSAALQRIRQHYPRFNNLSEAEVLTQPFALADAQFVLAREHGFPSWPKFVKHIESVNREFALALINDPVTAFIIAACVPRDGNHNEGTLDDAQAILTKFPNVAASNIFTAAILADLATVRRFIALDPANATVKGGPHNWDALTHLCFSRYLRLDPDREFVQTAEALLDAGASASTGWFEDSGNSEPWWESVIYGAAGSARHAGLTQLLLDRGADPNDDETPYHVPETYDNTVMNLMVESGKFNSASLATMLLRKADWHDHAGILYLLEHGADPNYMTRWQYSPFHHSVNRDNHISIIDIFLDHGADPSLPNRKNGRSAISMAARRGRADILDSLERRNILSALGPLDRLIAACARDDSATIRTLTAIDPSLVSQLIAEGATVLAEFAGNGNTAGVGHLLDLGVDPASVFRQGDGYWELARNSTALHNAAWRARHSTVALLVERGAPVNALDARSRTPLALAVRACVDSHWTYLRSPESVRILLAAGATLANISIPCGYDEVDALLTQHK